MWSVLLAASGCPSSQAANSTVNNTRRENGIESDRSGSGSRTLDPSRQDDGTETTFSPGNTLGSGNNNGLGWTWRWTVCAMVSTCPC